MYSSKSNNYLKKSQKKEHHQSKEQQELTWKRLVSPTKSLNLRKDAIVKSKEEQQKAQEKSSRNLDNHHGKIHIKSWISPGMQPKIKYENDDCGLIPKLGEKTYENQLNQQRQQLNELTKVEFREYQEYSKIREGEAIATIEYCTNCKDHQGSTRHNEEQYLNTALDIKKNILKHYPVIKVYLKPLITEENERSLENQYSRKRLGALEVQLAINMNGSVKKSVLFSKLQSKKWPSQEIILNKIRDYMQTCTFKVQISLDQFDPADLDNSQENKMRTAENKIFNINVILRPYRRPLNSCNNTNNYYSEKSFTMQDYSKSRPVSAIQKQEFNSGNSRPISALTSNNKSMNKKHGQKDHQILIQEKSNPEGLVVFENLPFDTYILEIKENNNFKGHVQKLDLFQKAQEGNYIEFIILQPVEITFARIISQFEDNKDVGGYTQKTYSHMNNANITIVQYNYDDQLIQEEMLQDIINNGVYETSLTPGKYKIIVQKFGFSDVEIDYIFRFGNQELKLPYAQKLQVSEEEKLKNTYKNTSVSQDNTQKSRVRPTSGRPNSGEQKNMPVRPSSANRVLHISVYEAGNFQTVIKNCAIRIIDKRRQIVEKFTDEYGFCNIVLDGFFEGTLEIEHDHYMKIVEEYGQNKMDLNKMTELSFPLIKKPETDNEVNILVLTDTDKQILNMGVINPKNEIISKSKGEILIEPNVEQCSILIKVNKIKQQNGIYRIFAYVNDLNYLSPQTVKLYIITQKNMHFVEVPKTHPQGLSKNIYWDIGVVCAPSGDFIEINACTSQEIKKDMYLYQYKKLIDFLYNSKQIDTKSILGFNKSEKDNDVLQIQGDTFVKKEKIEQSLEKYIDKNAKGIEHLINSALNTNGLYSYNKLKAKLDSIKYPVNFGNIAQVNEEEDEEDEML